MMQISEELEEALFGDPAVLRYLSSCEAAFVDGDRSALFETLTLCARFQAVIPDWAADAILGAKHDLDVGVREDFNAVFGWQGPGSRKRQHEALIATKAGEVIDRIIAHRIAGGSLSAEQAFGKVADETGLSRRIVEEIYRRHGTTIKDIPQGNPEQEGYITIREVIPWPRRRGRSTL
jgi:hypothetical protein